MAVTAAVHDRTFGEMRARVSSQLVGMRWWLPVVVAGVVVTGSLGSLTALAVDRSAAAVSGQVDARARDATSAARTLVRSRVELLAQLVTAYAQQPQVRADAASGALQPGPGPLTTTLSQLKSSAPGLVGAWVSDEHGVILATAPATRRRSGRTCPTATGSPAPAAAWSRTCRRRT